MSEYVPTTDEVRECWVMAEPSPDGYTSAGLQVPDEAGMYAEFDAWLEQERAAARREGQAEAWDEGYRARADDMSDLRAGRLTFQTITSNPYRNVEDRHVDQ